MFGQLWSPDFGAGVAVPPAESLGAVVAAGVGVVELSCAELTAPVAINAPTASATAAIPLKAQTRMLVMVYLLLISWLVVTSVGGAR